MNSSEIKMEDIVAQPSEMEQYYHADAKYDGDESSEFWNTTELWYTDSKRTGTEVHWTRSNPSIRYCLQHTRLTSVLFTKRDKLSNAEWQQVCQSRCEVCDAEGKKADAQIHAAHYNKPASRLREEWLQACKEKTASAHQMHIKLNPVLVNEQRAWYAYLLGMYTLGAKIRRILMYNNPFTGMSNEEKRKATQVVVDLQMFASDFMNRNWSDTGSINKYTIMVTPGCYFYCGKHETVGDLVPYQPLSGYNPECGICYTQMNVGDYGDEEVHYVDANKAKDGGDNYVDLKSLHAPRGTYEY